jgi:hypothetical protein
MTEGQSGTGPPAEGSSAGLRVFLNYRRDDSADAAGRLYDALAARFGHDRVFMDIDAIELGVDFEEVVNQAVDSSDVVIAVIGRQWLTLVDSHGRRRVDDPDDPVRMELEAALGADVRVVPVLVQGVEMPGSDELPEALRKLARRNALEMSPSRWNHDLGRLIEALEKIDHQKLEAEHAESEEAERQAAERRQAEERRAERERAERERAETERAETERAETERAETERAKTERAETERAERERADTEAAARAAPSEAARAAAGAELPATSPPQRAAVGAPTPPRRRRLPWTGAQRRVGLIAGVVALLAIAGAAVALLGGGGGSDFTAKADAICKEFSAKVKAVPRPSDSSQVASYLGQVLPIVQQGVSELRRVKPPPDKAAAYRDYLAGYDQTISLVDQGANANGDVSTQAAVLKQVAGLNNDLNAKASSLGLSECAR